jgi:hypothetical protein
MLLSFIVEYCGYFQIGGCVLLGLTNVSGSGCWMYQVDMLCVSCGVWGVAVLVGRREYMRGVRGCTLDMFVVTSVFYNEIEFGIMCVGKGIIHLLFLFA